MTTQTPAKTLSLKKRFSVDEEITKVHTLNHQAHTWTIARIGRKYLYCINPDHDPRYPWQAAHRRIDPDADYCFVLRGHRKELQAELGKMKEENYVAWQQYERDKRDAVWDFEKAWREAHPSPDNPVIERYRDLRENAA